MKLNNKGFAISSIMYMILVLGVILLSLILATLSSRRLILEKLKSETIKYILNEPICTLISDSDSSGSITIGDKYSCEVKDDVRFNFYVLSFNDDGSPNLIMERNICEDGTVATEKNKCLVAWYAPFEDHSYGPITAIEYLYNATKDWNNISNIIMLYQDENLSGSSETGTLGYGAIKTQDSTTIITGKSGEETFRVKNLKARMPTYNEIKVNGRCLPYNDSISSYGSCQLWLSNYLAFSEYVIGNELHNVDKIYGYWILSSHATSALSAWAVHYAGNMGIVNVKYDNYIGVRPVITVPTDKIEN